MDKSTILERWPNFFIVGTPKAGTTSLYYYLSKTPGIFMSPLKEPHFFAPNIAEKVNIKPIRDKVEYLDLFKQVKNEKILGEASTRYLQDEGAPYLIKKVIPSAKIIIVLRDPVERTFSDYVMYLHRNVFKLKFKSKFKVDYNKSRNDPHCKSIFDAGFYSKHVSRYLDAFGTEQIKIIIYENLIQEPERHLKEILRFLGTENKVQDFTLEPHNPYIVARSNIASKILFSKFVNNVAQRVVSKSGRRYFKDKILIRKAPRPKILEEDRKFLHDLYMKDVKKLEEMLSRQLPWPNFRES